MENNKPNKYFAFISYKREDEEWALWLQHEMEHYHLPTSFNGREDVRQNLRPVFRDIDELAAGNLPAQIQQALVNSQNLIVVCSPLSAASSWVNQEIETFISLGKTEQIFPFIVDGNSPRDYYPPAILALPKNSERLGGDATKQGRDMAFVKVVAGMLGLGFDTLWNRYEKEKNEEERKQREDRNKLLIAQSRFVAEKAMSIAEQDSYLARLLAVEVLPKDLENPDKPYTVEAERALRTVSTKNNFVLVGHTDRVNSSSFSRDGKLIVSASSDKTVRIWSVSTGQILRILKGHSKSVNFATFSPDGYYVVSASHDKTLILWDVVSGLPIISFIGHSNYVTYVSFSPNGKQIVSASGDKTLIIWDVETGNIIKRLEGHTDTINSVVYSPSGEFLVSSSEDRTVRYWNVNSGVMLAHVEFLYPANHASFSPNGENVVVSLFNSAMGIWKLSTGDLTEVSASATIGSFSPDGKQIISAYDGNVKIWDVETKSLVRTLNCHNESINYVEFNFDGNKIVSASNDKTISVNSADLSLGIGFHLKDSMGVYIIPNISRDGKWLVSNTLSKALRVWNLNTGELVRELCKTDCLGGAAFSYNGIWVASSMKNDLLNIWDMGTGSLVRSFRYKFDAFCSPAFSPNGKLIACATTDYLIVLLDIINKKGIRVYRGHSCDINVLSFTPDGNRLISASKDKSIKIWSVDSEQCIWSLEKHAYSVDAISLNSDGSILASASQDNTFILWDLKTGSPLWIEEGHSGGVSSVSFNSDDTLLVSASNCFIKIWDVIRKTEIMTLEWPGEHIIDVRFCNDGRRIMSLSREHNIKYWSFPPLQELIDQTRERFKYRPLTLEERKKYYLE